MTTIHIHRMAHQSIVDAGIATMIDEFGDAITVTPVATTTHHRGTPVTTRGAHITVAPTMDPAVVADFARSIAFRVA